MLNISIHAPRVGSDNTRLLVGIAHDNFNPRSPCGERQGGIAMAVELTAFQSTLPVWGATVRSGRANDHRLISIHAPRVGSDLLLPVFPFLLLYFNPRSPCGERLFVR